MLNRRSYSSATARHPVQYAQDVPSLSKNLHNFKNGVWGVAPMRVVSRWCRCIAQRLCATDCKRPCLVRAAAPHSAPARTPGVYAQRLCTMQSQQSIHSLSPRERGLGIGIENLLYFYKKRLFLQSGTAVFRTAVLYLCTEYTKSRR